MIRLKRINSSNQDFINLVKQLDADLAERDGSEHAFYNQFNKIAAIKHVVVAYETDKPVGCGAIKEFAPTTVEIKRMYTVPEIRGKGIATLVLAELEKWAAELLYTSCILETGKKQPEAIALYTLNGYKQTANYGQYSGVENSLCFEKEISGQNELKNKIERGLKEDEDGSGISFDKFQNEMDQWLKLKK